MSIPETLIAQKDFSAGQLSEEAARRDDTEIMRAGALVMSDWAWLQTAGLRRRPGSREKIDQNGRVLLVEPEPETVQTLVFQDGRVRIYDYLTDALEQTVSGAAWGTADLESLWIEAFDVYVVVCGNFQPQVLEYNGSSWSLSNFAFGTGRNGQSLQPFIRFAAPGVTLQPSALTGSITVTASASIFTSSHVGVYLRYVGRQMVITAYTSGTQVTATVIEDLPPTVTVPVTDASGFRIGDIVEGDTTNARGEVINIVSNTLTVVLTSNFSGFKNADVVVGPDHRSDATADSSSASPGATVQWDEGFMNAYRGWPRGCKWDRRRLTFFNFPQKPEAILWSAIDQIDDCLIGAEPDDAILEYVPDNSKVVALEGGADQFVMTDKITYYVPISEANPLQPGSVAFRRIGTGGAALVQPVITNEGVLFVSDERARIMGIQPTGTTTRPYILRNITTFHGEVINNVVRIASSPGTENAPGEYVYVVNGDGTVAFGRYEEGREWVGFMPWNPLVAVADVASLRQEVVMVMSEGSGSRIVEIDYDATFDIEYTLYSPDGELPVLDANGDPIVDGSGAAVTTGTYAFAGFEGYTVSALRNDRYIGEFVVGSGGALNLGDDPTLATYKVGFSFEPTLTPFAANFAGGENFAQRTRRRKNVRTIVTVRDSQGFLVTKGNRSKRVPAYRVGENQSDPAPLRDETYRFRFAGREFDPQVTIKQDIPGSLKILEVAQELTS